MELVRDALHDRQPGVDRRRTTVPGAVRRTRREALASSADGLSDYRPGELLRRLAEVPTPRRDPTCELADGRTWLDDARTSRVVRPRVRSVPTLRSSLTAF